MMPEEILLIDDEPFHIRWIAENLEEMGYNYLFSRNTRDALNQISSQKKYRMLLVDLNIPIFGADADFASQLGEIYVAFPGLVVAREARNMGYRSKQVVLYSAHKEGAVQDIADILGIEYITKGRTDQIMKAIEDILSYDPSK